MAAQQPEPDTNGNTDQSKAKPKRPSIVQVIRSYRLVSYVKPYKSLLALMLGVIIVLAGINFLQVLIVRNLLKDGLWLPPEPALTATIDELIQEDIPKDLQPQARQIILDHFDDALEAAKLTPKEKKKIEPEDVERVKEKLRRRIEDTSRPTERRDIHTVINEFLAPLGERAVPRATRRLYRQMSDDIAAGLTTQLSEVQLVRFQKDAEVFLPPPESQPQMTGILQLCGALVAVALVWGILVYTRTVIKARLVSRATFDIRNDLCNHLLDLDMKFFANRSSGDMISRQTNDIVAGTKALTDLFEELIPKPFEAIAFAVAAFYVSWKLALVCCLLLLVLPFPVLTIARKVKKYGRQKLERIADLTTLMSEIFQGMRVTKAFRIEDKKHQEFGEANERYVSRLFKTMRLRGLSTAVTETFLNLSIAIVMFFAAVLVTQGILGLRLDPPDVLAFAACMIMLYRPVKDISKAYPEFMESVVASERVFEILDIKPNIIDPPNAIQLHRINRSIAFQNVTFAYDTAPVLQDITFTAERGQVIAVVGHSGAGKSTLLDLIPRFHDPNTGHVLIDNVDIRTATLTSLRSQIAVVSQDPFLFQTTILENIRYGRLDATDDEIHAAAKAANIHDFILTLPDGYNTLCGERGVNLSGGQRQRITIARAILKDAPILILDEATSSLDMESERLVRDALNRLMEHRTTFVIAHRLSTVQHADRILVLRQGRLLETGTHTQLLDLKGEYWRLYSTEFESTALNG